MPRAITDDATATSEASGVPTFDHWIGGESRRPACGAYLESHSPATGELVAQVARGGAEDIALAAEAARGGQPGWAALSPRERAEMLIAICAAMRSEREHLVELEGAETGKPRELLVAEINASIDYFDYYAAVVRTLRGDTIDAGPGHHVFTMREPFGVIGIITPWNGPLIGVTRSIAPAIAVGNAVITKPSEFTSTTTLTLARIASEAGLPAGILNVVSGLGREAGAALVEHPLISRVSFTGSIETGRAISRVAAERLIPLTLELGGKSPNIIFADADLDRAAEVAARAFTFNSGQICSAGTRLLVERKVEGAVVQRIVDHVAKLKPGTQLGPIITEAQFEKVKGYFEIAAKDGARVETGGQVADGARELAGGRYVEPTIYTGVTNAMRIAREEIFGPVLVVIPFEGEEDAVAIANDTKYGLAAGVWTSDVGRALRVASRLEAGQVYVNEWNAGIDVPFGGYKQSGYGREKGLEALREFTQLKSVSIDVVS